MGVMILGRFAALSGETCRTRAGSARGRLLRPAPILLILSAAALIFPHVCSAQVDYVVRFTLEKQKFLLGGPIFCTFTVQNTGTATFAFSYRSPSRVLNPELEQEPRFTARTETGHSLPDPAPKPCGGAKGSAVYGSVSLPPGQSHRERWLLNEWARFSRPGRYHVHAERRLPFLAWDPSAQKFSEQPAAYALAINDLSFEVVPSTEAELEAVFAPYVKTVEHPAGSDPAESVLVLTTLPQPFFLEKLQALANASPQERRWDRRQALEGLARLGTRAAWETILKIARGSEFPRTPSRAAAAASADESLRAYAVLLLGEKGDTTFLPALLEMVSTGPEGLRGDVLRVLGLFHDPRANQILFERLHSASPNDRVNAILGLKNLESKDAVPALLAMLNDPEAQVRQVANFALQSLTGQKFRLSASTSRAESARTAERWHAWWRENGASFVPVPPPPCQDW